MPYEKENIKYIIMRKIILIFCVIFFVSVLLFSCGRNNNKQKELELKEKELEVKDSILNTKLDSINLLKLKEELWPKFWQSFSNAVRNKNKEKIVELSLKGNEFFDGGGGNDAKNHVEFLDKDGRWNYFVASINSGVKPHGEEKITKDNTLIFVFKNKKWNWYGVMGD
jgi:hypothetical protein